MISAILKCTQSETTLIVAVSLINDPGTNEYFCTIFATAIMKQNTFIYKKWAEIMKKGSQNIKLKRLKH